MPDDQTVVTDSWRGYQECTRCIEEFLREITVRDSEVWLREVCLGSPDRPGIRAPLQVDSAELIQRSIERAQGLIAAIKGSLQCSVETSRRVTKELLDKGADKAELAQINARTDALDRLRTELTDAATVASCDFHPAVLVRWRGILGQSFVSGDPTVHVKVTIVYVL